VIKVTRQCNQCGKTHEERFPDVKSGLSYIPEGLVMMRGSSEFYFCGDECAVVWLKGEEPKPQPIGKDIVAKLAELTPTKLEYSEYTNCFYVHTNAEIGGDSFLSGITEHRATKEEAYEAFAQRITNLPQGKYLVIDAMKDSRKHYTWNGSEFVQIDEVTRKDVT
jgi:hypothetical protein